VVSYTRESLEIQVPSTLEPDRPQHDGAAACVIAQQYSFSTIMTLRFLPRKEIRRAFKNIM
jgi:hypothetical protein